MGSVRMYVQSLGEHPDVQITIGERLEGLAEGATANAILLQERTHTGVDQPTGRVVRA